MAGLHLPEDLEEKISEVFPKIRDIDAKLRKNRTPEEEDLQNILEYTRHLNLPLEVEVSFKFTDLDVIPGEWKDIPSGEVIPIRDINVEIARVLFLLGLARERAAESLEEEKKIEEAVQSLSHSARAYLTASLFSRVTLQPYRELGSLDSHTLEIRAENMRALAQSLLEAKAEEEGNVEFSARLSMGLAWINQRILSLLEPRSVESAHTRGLIAYDQARAAKKLISKNAKQSKKSEETNPFEVAAAFLFNEALSLWKAFLEKTQGLSEEGRALLKENIDVVKDELASLSVTPPKQLDKGIFDQIPPEIPIPENQFLFFPKSLGGLAMIYDSYLKRKERAKSFAKYRFPRKTREELKQDQFSLERTIVELRKLVKEGSIDTEEFSELSRKYMEELYHVISALNRTRD